MRRRSAVPTIAFASTILVISMAGCTSSTSVHAEASKSPKSPHHVSAPVAKPAVSSKPTPSPTPTQQALVTASTSGTLSLTDPQGYTYSLGYAFKGTPFEASTTNATPNNIDYVSIPTFQATISNTNSGGRVAPSPQFGFNVWDLYALSSPVCTVTLDTVPLVKFGVENGPDAYCGIQVSNGQTSDAPGSNMAAGESDPLADVPGIFMNGETSGIGGWVGDYPESASVLASLDSPTAVVLINQSFTSGDAAEESIYKTAGSCLVTEDQGNPPTQTDATEWPLSGLKSLC